MDNITFANIKNNEYLKNQLKSGEFAHFMLFVGQEGIGKEDSALEFAKVVLCEKRSDEACLSCRNCKLTNTGNHPDLLRVGGEGAIKITEIRDIQKNLFLKPYQAKYKVAIIKDAHFLTEESANAMLKVLEEPPENSIIIMTVSDKTLLPGTIVSRSQVVNFGIALKAQYSQVDEQELKMILGKESRVYEKFSLVQKYAKDKSLVKDLLDSLEVNLRSRLLQGQDNERNIIKLLELVQRSRGYLRANVSAKFVLENLVLNMGVLWQKL